jgi:hypothetical protein
MNSKSQITKLYYKIPSSLPLPVAGRIKRIKGGASPINPISPPLKLRGGREGLKQGVGEILRRICSLHHVTNSNQQKGLALVIALVMLLVLTLVGLSAINMTGFEANISGNQRVYNMAFYTADGGVENFRGRVSGGEFIYSAATTGSYQVAIGGNTCNIGYEKWNRNDSEGYFTIFKVTSEGRAPFPSSGRVTVESVIEVLTTQQPGYN